MKNNDDNTDVRYVKTKLTTLKFKNNNTVKGLEWEIAAPVFIIGGNNTGKIIGTNPNLDDLVNGDLKHQYDFRSIYATLLKQKLGVEPLKAGIKQEILRGVFFLPKPSNNPIFFFRIKNICINCIAKCKFCKFAF